MQFTHRFLLACLLLSSFHATAHHSINPFDQSSFEEIEGVVTQVGWRNPHFSMVLNVTDADGVEEEWDVVSDSINALMRRGLTHDQFEVGQRVHIAGHPSARGRRELLATNILLPGGEELLLNEVERPLRWTNPAVDNRSSDAERTSADIFRVWSHDSLYQRKEPFELTEKAELAVALFDPLTDTPALKCIAPGMPNANLNPYPIEFIDEGDNIRLRIEEWEAERIIDMVSSEIPNDVPHSLLGYSIGRFVGNTLEIRTGRLDSPLLDDDGIPMSSDAEIFEKYTIKTDGVTLAYEVSVTDPEYLAEPANWIATWKWVPGAVIRSFECNLEE